jgi:hypothetical protein
MKSMEAQPIQYLPMNSAEYEITHCVNMNGSNQQVWKPVSQTTTAVSKMVIGSRLAVKAVRRVSKAKSKTQQKAALDGNVALESPTSTSHFDMVFGSMAPTTLKAATAALESPTSTSHFDMVFGSTCTENVVGTVHVQEAAPVPSPEPPTQEPPPSTISNMFTEVILGSMYMSWEVPICTGGIRSYDIRVKDTTHAGWTYIEKSFDAEGPDVTQEGPVHSFYLDPLVWNLVKQHSYEFSVRAVSAAGAAGEYGQGVFTFKKK